MNFSNVVPHTVPVRTPTISGDFYAINIPQLDAVPLHDFVRMREVLHDPYYSLRDVWAIDLEGTVIQGSREETIDWLNDQINRVQVTEYLKAHPHVEHTLDPKGIPVITHDDDRAHFILKTVGAGR